MGWLWNFWLWVSEFVNSETVSNQDLLDTGNECVEWSEQQKRQEGRYYYQMAVMKLIEKRPDI